jgi:ABC-type transport system substrate-binding protein
VAERKWGAAIMALLVAVAACTSATPTNQPSEAPAAPAARTTGPKQIVAAIAGSPRILSNKFDPSTNKPGLDAVENLINAGFTNFDESNSLALQLGEAIPTLDNGRWKLLPDGKMETVFVLKLRAIWHDGAPYTSDDLAFTLQVGRDREIAVAGAPAYAYIESVSTPDERTIVLLWSQPYIRADRMFGKSLALPLPAHILRRAYEENKSSFTDQPYWGSEFIGSGPYKVKEFNPRSNIVVTAFDSYIMAIDQNLIPTQRAGDRPYRATFPGLELLRGPIGEDLYQNYASSRIPLPTNTYQVTGNYSRYNTPQWNALIDKFYTTIPMDERMQVLSDLTFMAQDQLPFMGLFFDSEVALISNRLVNVNVARADLTAMGWNAETWDLR